MRFEEKEAYSVEGAPIICYVDISANTKFGAILSISRTLIITVILFVGGWFVHDHTDRLIVLPFENMQAKVRFID